MIRVALNGFGRIGRLFTRFLLEEKGVALVGINDLGDPEGLAHLFQWDSVHGKYAAPVAYADGHLHIGDRSIAFFQQRDPSQLPWGKLGVDVVVEATGKFRTGEGAAAHLRAGAGRVVLSAPGKDDAFKTVVIGVNHDSLTSEDTLISNASCTTNCLAPVLQVLDQRFGLKEAMMSTIHAYTADQRLMDAPHPDLRRARAAAINIIPTTTGAARAIEKVLPHLAGKVTATSYRVPVPDGSLIDVVATLARMPSSVEALAEAFQSAAEGPLQDILQYSTDPLVSSDITGNTHSAIVDAGLFQVSKETVRVVAWYDNESGYSRRLAELVSRYLPVR